MYKKLLSIIIPTYNNEKNICTCLDSIITQIDFNQIEIIVVNDGSSDNTKKRLLEYKGKINLINQSNHGVSFSRNVGIKEATGKYIWFIDADDKIALGALNGNFLHELEKEYNDVLLCGLTKVNNNVMETDIVNTFSGTICREDIGKNFDKIFTENLLKPIWNKIYYRKFLIKNNIFFKKIRIGEDAVFNYSVFSRINKLKIINSVKYIYYVNSSTSSNFSFDQDYLKNALYRLSLLKGMLSNLKVQDSNFIDYEIIETVLGAEMNFFNISNTYSEYKKYLSNSILRKLKKEIRFRNTNKSFKIKYFVAKSSKLSYLFCVYKNRYAI